MDHCPMCRQGFLPPGVIGLSDTIHLQPKIDEITALASILKKHKKTVILCEEPEYAYIVVPAISETGEEVK